MQCFDILDWGQERHPTSENTYATLWYHLKGFLPEQLDEKN